MQKKYQILPKIMWIPLFITITFNCFAYYIPRIVMADKIHYNISSAIDEQIPFLPWTIIIYWGCYLFWIVNYVIGCRQRRDEAFRFISADLLAKVVCMICFLLIPTTNIRPVVEGNSIWDEAMRLLYRVDAADNLFPSIHCLTSWFSFIAVRKNDKVPKWYKCASFIIAVSICISTLTTKQHVLLDVFAGVALAEASYQFVVESKMAKYYCYIILKICNKIIRRRLPGE